MRAKRPHLQGSEQLFDGGHNLLLPRAAADHRKALRNRLLRALASILHMTNGTAVGTRPGSKAF